MVSLDIALADLDRRIDAIREQRDRCTGPVRARLQRQVDFLGEHERAAIHRQYAAHQEQQADEDVAVVEKRAEVAEAKRSRAQLFATTPSSHIVI